MSNLNISTKTRFDLKNTKLANYGDCLFIVADIEKDTTNNGSYIATPIYDNVITFSSAKADIDSCKQMKGKDTFIIVEKADLDALFTGNNSAIMIFIQDIGTSTPDLIVSSYSATLFEGLLNSQNKSTNKKDHNCFMMEKKFYDGNNLMFPNGVGTIRDIENFIFILGYDSNVKEYCLIFNGIKTDNNNPNGWNLLEAPPAGVPPSVGSKIPTK